MVETDCIQIEVVNYDGVFIEYKWQTVNDFLKDINSNKKDIPKLDDRISTMHIYRKIFSNEKLDEMGLLTVGNFVIWCKKIPKINENEYWTDEAKCVYEGSSRRYIDNINRMVFKKDEKYFLVKGEMLDDKWLYQCQGYELRGWINSYGNFEYD